MSAFEVQRNNFFIDMFVGVGGGVLLCIGNWKWAFFLLGVAVVQKLSVIVIELTDINAKLRE